MFLTIEICSVYCVAPVLPGNYHGIKKAGINMPAFFAMHQALQSMLAH